MSSRYRINLTFSILASLAALLLLTWILLSIISFKIAEKDLLAIRAAHARTLLQAVVAVLPENVTTAGGMGAPMQRVIDSLAADRDFAGFTLIDSTGKVLYSQDDRRGVDAALLAVLKGGAESSSSVENGRVLLSYVTIGPPAAPAGAARLVFSLGEVHARLAKSRKLFLVYFILDFVLLLGLGGYMLRRIIVAPLEKLLLATERVIAGDYSHQVHLPGSTEISELADSFNLMQITLKERRDEVGNHLKALQEARLETLRSEKMASVGLLAAGMAHEIGAPLAGIIGYSGILAEELAGDAEKSDYLRRIAADAGRIDRLVRDLLNYARPMKPEIERIETGEFLEDLFAMLERQGLFKRHEARLQIAADLPALYLDRHQLMQVLLNLIMNARDAMPDGGTLTISAAADAPGAVLFTVTDSGSGIAAENLEKIFEPFFTTKEPGQGTGLGLAISARLVEAFGGSIAVTSVPGETSFTVRLPGVTGE